jgi:hypothetical protein
MKYKVVVFGKAVVIFYDHLGLRAMPLFSFVLRSVLVRETIKRRKIEGLLAVDDHLGLD